MQKLDLKKPQKPQLPKIFFLVLIHCLFFNKSFSQIPEFQANGDAVSVPGEDFCYELTQAVNSQAGSIWNLEQLDLSESFELRFTLSFGTNDGGADGIYFALQPINTSIGGTGGGIGFDGIVPSLGVEFDTWQNSVNGDPANDHIAIMQNGVLMHNTTDNLAGPVNAIDGTPNIEDGEEHLVYIVWTANSQIFRVFFDCEPRLTYSGDIVNDIFGGDPNVFWGFTSATGGANNLHGVCLLAGDFFDIVESQEICLGDEVEITAPLGESYEWEPVEGLSEDGIQNPMASPDTTTTYTVKVYDECGTFFEHELLVEVDSCGLCDDNLIFVETPIDSFSICQGATQELNATGVASYAWFSDGNLNLDTIPNPIASPTESTWYYVNGTTVDGCPSTDSIFVEVNAPPALPQLWDTTVCAGITQEVSLTGIENNPNWTYTWNPPNLLDNANIAQPTATIDDETSFLLTVSDENNCSSMHQATIFFSEDVLQIDIPEESICFGGDANIDISQTGFDTYVWDDGFDGPIQEIKEAGSYGISFLNTATGCEGEGTLLISEDALPESSLPSLSFCEGSNLEIDANDLGLGNFTGLMWQDGSTSTLYTISESENLSIQITDANNCISQANIEVTENSNPQPQITGSPILYTGQSTTLSSDPLFANYEWSNGETSSSIIVTTEGLYTLTVTDENNCKGFADLNVWETTLDTLLVPSAFTPNDDGQNDVFQLISSGNITQFSMQIFNRWGQLVFISKDIGTGWDGKFNGENAPLGVYLYSIEAVLENGQIPVLKGNVTLIR